MKKLLLCLFGFYGICLLVYGCHNMAKPMGEGEIIYSRKCSSCHNLIEPNLFNKEQWQHYVDKYGKKITDEEKQILMNYLTGSQQ